MKNKISACLVVYNEEKVIERCLRSIKKVADEIIVVHDGPCKDKTLDIVRKYTNKIFVKPHIGIAEPHRVLTYQKATGDWILKIDADEFLPERTRQAIKGMVGRKDADGYALLWCLWDGKKYITKDFPHKLCLFRKEKMSYIGFPAAEEQVDGNILNVDYELGHKPQYNNYELSTFKTKWLKWAKVQAEYTLKEFGKLAKFNYKKKDFKFAARMKKRFPEILMVPLAVLTFFKTFLIDGYFKAKMKGLNYSVMCALYQAALCYHIHELKQMKKN